MATSISAILIPCLKSFNQLQERVEQPDYSHEREVSSVSWGDELGRLRVWAANIGAHQTGQSSLDFRLRDASHISNQISILLRDLNRSLDDILEELLEDETEASEDEEAEASWLDDNSTTELQQLHEEVINIIDCLYQLSMLIRKPAQHDLLVGSRVDDKAEFAFYDKEHVRNLHPRTEEQISQRLGRAITRRRKYLNYRERHHRKLKEGIEEVQGIQRTTTGSVMSETIATDFKSHNIDFEETSSHSGISQTSYAPSLIDGGRVTIPPPPRESVGGKPFECPYCFFVINIKNTRSWTRHIFKDIKPYLCTFADCSMPDRLYDSRREWYFHEATEHHREDFVCALCKDALKSSKQYERHVARHLEELALFALPRTEMDDAEDDDDDVVDAGASTSKNGVTVDTAHSPDHSDHSSLASVTDDEDSTGTNDQVRPRSYSPVLYDQSVTDDEDSTGTDVQVRPRSYSPDHSDRSSLSVTDDEDNRSPDVTISRRGRDRDRERQTIFHLDRTNSAEPAFAAFSPINLHDRMRRSRNPSPYYDPELKRKMMRLEELEETEKEEIAWEKYEEERFLKEEHARKKRAEELLNKTAEEFLNKNKRSRSITNG